MLISGFWLVSEDNIRRPVIKCEVLGSNGKWWSSDFLVDLGADRTVFMEQFLTALALPHLSIPEQLEGVGGAVSTVAVDTKIRFAVDDGGKITFEGKFAAFTKPDAIDTNILGRDILNLFAVIADRRRDVVCMIGQGHQYTITRQT